MDLAPSGELVSLVGGGGKTALLFALAEALPGRVVLTTTTRIFAAQIDRARSACTAEPAVLEAALATGATGLLVIGRVEGEKAMGVAPELPALLLARPDVDCVVVEADGSRMRPAKAPAEHEPVVPHETTRLVVLAGIDALAGPIAETTHRPERVSALTGLSPDACLTPAGLARLLADPEGGLKGCPPSARATVLLNKVESARDAALAGEVARAVLAGGRVDRVLVGALAAGPEAPWTVTTSR